MPRPSEPTTRDPLAAYRDRAMYFMAIAGVVVLMPLMFNNFVHDRYELGGAIASVVVMLVVDAWAVGLERRPPIPYAVLLFPITAAIAISLKTQGVIGAFWCYPAILFFFFVLSRRMASLCSAILVAAAALLLDAFIGLGTAVRFAMSALLTIVVANIILNIVGDLQKRLTEQAITDPLTGAFNRRHMEVRLDEAIARSRRSGSPSALLLVDIDHFKGINDASGHERGDAVLKGVVDVIRNRARRSDLLFRMGGEEFLLLLPDTRQSQAVALAEELRATIADAPIHASPVTVSIGVAALDPRDSLDEWVHRADTAMYAAKAAGRNRVCVERLPPEVERRLAGV